ncbi:hypothetical protein FE257_011054 [Aspergillus nanangensis]|uniref:Uncharacterized protein n=1 Tax=Aspergillus nanangensis TaxID=2582783 RepID=A0AAD4CIB0_ASPNN|nr:hypothetical protein FE257_011054 [Aspergillus nanangensis]
MGVTREQLLESTRVFLANMNDFSPDVVLSGRTEDCTTLLAPRSLGAETLSNEKFRSFFTDITAQMKNFRLEFMPGASPIVDEVNRKVVMHLKSYADVVSGTYENEYIFIITFNEDGTLLQDCIEFVDSGYFQKFLARQEAALKSA